MSFVRIDLALIGISIFVFLATLAENIFRNKKEIKILQHIFQIKRHLKRKIVGVTDEEKLKENVFTKTVGSMKEWVVNKKRGTPDQQNEDFLNVRNRIKKSDICFSRGEWEDAEKHLVDALAFDPVNQEIHKKLVLVYMKRQQYSKAELLCLKLIEQGTKDPAVYSNLGLILYHQQRLDMAIKAYEKAIELDPRKAVRYANIGQIYYELTDVKNAIIAFEQAHLLSKRDTNYMFILGKLYEELQQKEKAKYYYHKILDIDPYNAEVKDCLKSLL